MLGKEDDGLVKHSPSLTLCPLKVSSELSVGGGVGVVGKRMTQQLGALVLAEARHQHLRMVHGRIGLRARSGQPGLRESLVEPRDK